MFISLSSVRNVLGSNLPININAVIAGITAFQGSNLWSAYTGGKWVHSDATEAENFGEFYQAPTARWPNGYYLIPEKYALEVTGDVDYSYPIVTTPVFDIACAMYAPAQGLGSLNYVGPTGAGPIDIGVDCAIWVETALLFTVGNVNLTVSEDTVQCLAISGSQATVRNTLFSAGSPFVVISGAMLNENCIFSDQVNPAIIANSTSSQLVSLSNAEFLSDVALNIDTSFSTAQSRLSLNNVRATNTGTNKFISVADDTIFQGTVNDCRVPTASIANFITGIDEKALNTVFAGNNFENTLRKGGMAVDNNAAATPSAGAGVPTQLTATYTASATNSGFAMNTNGTLETIVDSFEGNVAIDFNVSKQGGGANQIIVYIYKNGSVLTDNGVPASRGPLTIEPNDFVGGSVNIPIVSVAGDEFEVWGEIDGTDLMILSSCTMVVST